MNRRYFLQASVAGALTACLPMGRLLADTPVAGAIEAVTGGGSPISLDKAALQELKASLRGPVILSGQPGYDEARRVLNQSIDRYPALVVQPTGVADIRTAVDFARERELLVAVKCGGHSYSGRSTCDRGMQIDLSRFRGVRVDPVSRTAYVSGGSLLGELDHEAMAYGLVTTAGTVSHTGVAGLTLGGGFGRIARRHGLALDNLRAVEIVTADGKVVRANASENPDLFWGVRGGGGNFGIVTTFEFTLHPMSRRVAAGDLIFPLSRARELLDFYVDYSVDAPDDLYTDVVMSAPPGGKDGVFLLHVCYTGAAAQAESVLAPVRKLGTPLAGKIESVDYVAVQRSWDTTDPRSEGEYLKSGFIDGVAPTLVRTILDGFQPDPRRGTSVFFQHSGGAIGRIASDATAFPHRRSTHNMFSAVRWSLAGDPTQHVGYLKKYWATLEPFTDGYYTNEVGDEAQRYVDENYQGNLARLQAVKRKYDPGNLFRLNANVKPV